MKTKIVNTFLSRKVFKNWHNIRCEIDHVTVCKLDVCYAFPWVLPTSDNVIIFNNRKMSESFKTGRCQNPLKLENVRM